MPAPSRSFGGRFPGGHGLRGVSARLARACVPQDTRRRPRAAAGDPLHPEFRGLPEDLRKRPRQCLPQLVHDRPDQRDPVACHRSPRRLCARPDAGHGSGKPELLGPVDPARPPLRDHPAALRSLQGAGTARYPPCRRPRTPDPDAPARGLAPDDLFPLPSGGPRRGGDARRRPSMADPLDGHRPP